MSANKLLTDAAQIMQERAKQYDIPTCERSMCKAVAAFNCVTGNKMTEAEGWLLLQLLKDVRQWSTPNAAHVDSLQDCIANAALKAECIIEQNHIPDVTEMIYSDTGYTEQDMQAASLVHDALDPAMVELCGNTTDHDDDDGWHVHVGNEPPVSDKDVILIVMGREWGNKDGYPAGDYCWDQGIHGSITHWRYANKDQ